MLTIQLPRLIAGTARAIDFVDDLAFDSTIAGENIEVNCSECTSLSPIFAHELLAQLWLDQKAGKVLLVGASDEQFEMFMRAANQLSSHEKIGRYDDGSVEVLKPENLEA